MTKKTVPWAFIVARDEAEDIRGAIKTCQFFADKVICIIPYEDVEMHEIILEEFPDVGYAHQVSNLEGINQAHKSLEKAINKCVEEGEWWFMLAADERFDPAQWDKIHRYVTAAQQFADGIYCATMHNFYPDESHCIDYYSDRPWGTYLYVRFQKKVGYWTKGLKAHSGHTMPTKMVPMPYPFYHYSWVKKSRVPFGGERDQQRFKDLPRYELENPIKNWRNLD